MRWDQKNVPVECRGTDRGRIVVVVLLGSNNSRELGGGAGAPERVAKLGGHS